MMKFNHELSDDLTKLFVPWDFGKHTGTLNIIRLTEQDISSLFKDALLEVGLYVLGGRIFHISPNNKYAVHVDEMNPYPNTFAKINYVLGGTDSFMNWFELKEGKTYHKYIDQYGDEVIGFSWEDCNEIYRAHIPEKKLTLLDVGTPHSLTNKVDWRTCYSMVLADVNTKKNITFEDAKHRLSKYIVD